MKSRAIREIRMASKVRQVSILKNQGKSLSPKGHKNVPDDYFW